MKRNDIAIIVAIAAISGIMSFALANLLFGGKKAYQLKAPTIEPISAEFKQPDTTYFNRNSLDITKDITIGDSSNSQPFNTK